jgi:hypothetical protein
LADAHEQQDYGTLIEDVKSFASSYDLTSYLPVLINGALLCADASHPEIRLSDYEARALEGETDSRWTQPGQVELAYSCRHVRFAKTYQALLYDSDMFYWSYNAGIVRPFRNVEV